MGIGKSQDYAYGKRCLGRIDHKLLARLRESLQDFDNQRVFRWHCWHKKYNYSVKYAERMAKVKAKALSRRSTTPELYPENGRPCDDSFLNCVIRTS